MVEHSVWTGCIGHRGTYHGKLRKTGKKKVKTLGVKKEIS